MSSSLRGSPANAVNFFFLVDIFTCVLGIMILIALMMTLQVKPGKIVLEPGVPPPLVKLDDLMRSLEDLNRSNETLTAELAALKDMPNSTALAKRLKELQLLQAKLLAARDRLMKELAALTQMINKTLDRYGVASNLNKLGDLTNTLARLNLFIVQFQASNNVLQAKIDQAKTDVAQQATKRELNAKALINQGKQPVLITVSQERVVIESGWDRNQRIALARPVLETDFLAALTPFEPTKSYLVFFVRPSGISLYNTLHAAAENAHYEVGSDSLEETMELVITEK